MQETNGNHNRSQSGDASALALNALGWILSDDKKAERMLDLTGWTPDGLRNAITSQSAQAAILRFLESYEPDLVACAQAMGSRPEALVAARRELEA
jgi:hypothetical protein